MEDAEHSMSPDRHSYLPNGVHPTVQSISCLQAKLEELVRRKVQLKRETKPRITEDIVANERIKQTKIPQFVLFCHLSYYFSSITDVNIPVNKSIVVVTRVWSADSQTDYIFDVNLHAGLVTPVRLVQENGLLHGAPELLEI